MMGHVVQFLAPAQAKNEGVVLHHSTLWDTYFHCGTPFSTSCTNAGQVRGRGAAPQHAVGHLLPGGQGPPHGALLGHAHTLLARRLLARCMRSQPKPLNHLCEVFVL
eukprot:1159118-Pelagomonas_calceolata.AAC.6